VIANDELERTRKEIKLSVLRYYTRIYLDRLRKITKILRQNNRSSGQDSKPKLYDYKAEIPPAQSDVPYNDTVSIAVVM
jgi:hypothetical protein